jgi:hypothetical protein
MSGHTRVVVTTTVESFENWLESSLRVMRASKHPNVGPVIRWQRDYELKFRRGVRSVAARSIYLRRADQQRVDISGRNETCKMGNKKDNKASMSNAARENPVLSGADVLAGN